MFKKIADGFMFTVGAFLALNVIGMVDGMTKVSFGKKTDKKCECNSSGECNCGSTEE